MRRKKIAEKYVEIYFVTRFVYIFHSLFSSGAAAATVLKKFIVSVRVGRRSSES